MVVFFWVNIATVEKNCMNTHARNVVTKCKLCSKGYAQQDYLNKHVKSVHGVKDKICSECNKSFKQQGELDKHFSRVHLRIKKSRWSFR